jgi:hypothetical protein
MAVMLSVPALFAAGGQGVDGFLGTRGSIMLDVVFLAMFAVVPVLLFSVYLAKVKGRFAAHKTIQLALGIVLLLAVAAFEVDLQLVTDWRLRAQPSPYFRVNEWNAVLTSLVVHLAFAVPTLFLWIFVIVQALRKFPAPPRPNAYSPSHKKVAWAATVGMIGTALTGWVFYWMAFVA